MSDMTFGCGWMTCPLLHPACPWAYWDHPCHSHFLVTQWRKTFCLPCLPFHPWVIFLSTWRVPCSPSVPPPNCFSLSTLAHLFLLLLCNSWLRYISSWTLAVFTRCRICHMGEDVPLWHPRPCFIWHLESWGPKRKPMWTQSSPACPRVSPELCRNYRCCWYQLQEQNEAQTRWL